MISSINLRTDAQRPDVALRRPPTHLPNPEECKQMHQAYQDLLRAFAHDADPAASREIVEREVCRLEDVYIQFKLNLVTEQVGVYVNLGKPQPWQEREVCRRLLELQFEQGTPAIWILGRNAESGHVVLVSHFVMGPSASDDARHLRLQTQTCLQVAKGIRGFLFQ